MQLCESSADDPKALLKGELGPTNSAKKLGQQRLQNFILQIKKYFSKP